MVKPLHEIEKQQCVEAGVLTKIHGIHGELILSLNQEFTGDIEEMELIFIEIDEGLVPFFIDVDSTRYKNDRQVILKLDDVATTEETTELLNCSVFIPKTTTQNNDAPALNLSSIEGFTVTDSKVGELGKIAEIIDVPLNPLIRLEYLGNDILIPLHEELIAEFDFDNKRIVINLPDGLLELYV